MCVGGGPCWAPGLEAGQLLMGRGAIWALAGTVNGALRLEIMT